MEDKRKKARQTVSKLQTRCKIRQAEVCGYSAALLDQRSQRSFFFSFDHSSVCKELNVSVS